MSWWFRNHRVDYAVEKHKKGGETPLSRAPEVAKFSHSSFSQVARKSQQRFLTPLRPRTTFQSHPSMSIHQTFAFFKPGRLEVDGYAYGYAVIPDDSDSTPSVDVHRVSSGRWQEMGNACVPRPRPELVVRTVTEAEAISGIGTYVGSCVCIARASSGQGPPWEYGAVSGYSWDAIAHSGVLHISFDGGVEPVSLRPNDIRNLTYSSYALRPCIGRTVCDLMPAEMRVVHEATLKHFKTILE